LQTTYLHESLVGLNSPRKAQTQNWIRRGFEQLFSSISWRVIGLQSSARKVAHAGLKGLSYNV